ncbi:hypothetical protein POM88_031287 [Heracleum sosnowskyi]|uniref:F-box domain-containing protein n=1 Tax=Heracleum sosnowskyi TaxID=360622 RepID=A0AAD8MJL9_9APIA|nr:hypothetical protein POM88_031286 [Heracleum sosnowskyi]KAK1375094.1 hypothetical protein POM88_031287 [Heracleum sosnowskyi]
MKRDDTRMTDIPSDIQKHILKLLATSSEASDFVRATSSCKEWKEFAEDAEILKTVQFDRMHRLDKSFWNKNRFLVKCLNAGNRGAFDIIVLKKKQDVLKVFMQKLKAGECWPDMLQLRNELRRTRS